MRFDDTDPDTADATDITGNDAADSAVPETNWLPTRASSAVALLGTVAGIVALSRAVGVETGVLVASAGAVGLAVVLWLLTVDRWRAPATLTASLLLVPAGGAVVAGAGYELLVQFASLFPAPTEGRVIANVLRVVGAGAVVCGCTLAAFGASSSVRNVAARETLVRCFGLAVRTAVLPVGFAVALAVRALVTNFDAGLAGAVDRFGTRATDWVFASGETATLGEPRLFGFWVAFTVAAFATYRALRALPTRELAGDAEVGDVELADVADAVERGSVWLAFGALAGLPVALLVGAAMPAEVLRDALPPAVYGPLADVTASSGLRHALVRIAVVAAGLAAVAALVRRSARTSTGDLLVGYAPYLAGLGVVAGVGLAHRPVFDALVDFVAGRLDAPLAGQFRRLSGNVVEFYGSETVVLGLTAVVAFLAALGLFALLLAFAAGFVSDRAGGASLAGGGLFLAAAFAGTLDASPWLVLGALAVALVVRDAGEFAATLGEEVGRRATTRRAELLHAVWSVAVGSLAVVAAGGLAGALPAGAGSGELGAASVALFGAVAAVVVLVAAMR